MHFRDLADTEYVGPIKCAVDRKVQSLSATNTMPGGGGICADHWILKYDIKCPILWWRAKATRSHPLTDFIYK